MLPWYHMRSDACSYHTTPSCYSFTFEHTFLKLCFYVWHRLLLQCSQSVFCRHQRHAHWSVVVSDWSNKSNNVSLLKRNYCEAAIQNRNITFSPPKRRIFSEKAYILNVSYPMWNGTYFQVCYAISLCHIALLSWIDLNPLTLKSL